MTCPVIQSGGLVRSEELAASSSDWETLIREQRTELVSGPAVVNLAYDKTCNLSCPSCRTSKYAADGATRARHDDLQEKAILPMLRHARTVFITGSGDPFASKNFRALMRRLDRQEYPELKFHIMTNGMLFTPATWAAFPSLHGRVSFLRISIDAATGDTHELLRRGARWSVMKENLAFAGQLRAEGLVDSFELAFTVQKDNYREMGDAVDLACELGADLIAFARITNWGTFTEADYRDKAVFLAEHPEHAAFLEVMQDPRLRQPVVRPGDLEPFAAPLQAAA